MNIERIQYYFMRGILAVVITLMFIAQSVYAIEYSVSCDSGSTSTSINAGIDDQIISSTVFSQNFLQNSLYGSGDFRDNHTIKNYAGDEITIGVNLENATSYVYSYALSPYGVNISASESLDVDHAGSIDAYARARAANSEKASSGDTAGSEIHIKNGALTEYSNGASVTNGVLSTHQEFTKASGDTVYFKSWGLDHMNYGPYVDRNRYNNYSAYANVTHGSVENYYDHVSMSSIVQINQSGHITGQFVSSSPVGLHRTSNYGSQFDLESSFARDISGPDHLGPSYDYSKLVYYVDQADSNANMIQGAIDAAISGDGIRIAKGTYYENLVIKKSLLIEGAGAGKTIIKPSKCISLDSIITVNKNAFVLLGGISLTKGHAIEGGAIKNEGTLFLKDYEISNNVAKYGGGIYNAGKLVLGSGTVSNNCANQDGGGVYNKGNSVILGSKIHSNEATYGGGVYNLGDGKVFLEGGDIVDNQASENGGGVWNDGLFVMDAGNISYNKAKNGGGVYNKKLFILVNGNISSNTANNGGAVFNKGNFTICNGTISKNQALNRGGAVYNDGGSIMLSGGDISHNRASENGGIHSTYNFKKKGIKGNQSIVHHNQNGNIGWHRNKGCLISVICGVIAAVILIALVTVLTIGVAMYITAAAAAAAAAATASATATASASATAVAAALSTLGTMSFIITTTGTAVGAAAGTAAAATAAAIAASAAAIASAVAATLVVVACVGFTLLTADAIAWLLGIHYAK